MSLKMSIRRIHAGIRELEKHPSRDYVASPPFEDNLFVWHFTIRGPPGTEFEGGVYHGRIDLPSSYPFKPPNIVFLTPNGRFSTGAKICLSISAHHPEQWQPAWGLRLILEALISLLPTESEGAIGGLDWSPKERRTLALQSRKWTCAECGIVSELLEKAGELADKVGTSKDGEAFAAQAQSLRFRAVDAVDEFNSEVKSISWPAVEKVEEKDETEVISTFVEPPEEMDAHRPVPPTTATLQMPQLQLWADKFLSAIAMALIVSIVAVVMFKLGFVHYSSEIVSVLKRNKAS